MANVEGAARRLLKALNEHQGHDRFIGIAAIPYVFSINVTCLFIHGVIFRRRRLPSPQYDGTL